MTSSDIKSLLEKCHGFTTLALSEAASLAVRRTHYEVTIEHFFLACLEKGGDIALILKHFGVNPDELSRSIHSTIDEFRTGNTGRPVFSPLLLEVLESAWLVSTLDLSCYSIRSGSILLAFLKKPAIYAQGSYIDILAPVRREEVAKTFLKLTDGSPENAKAKTPEGAAAPAGAPGSGESFIAKYCEDFTAKAKAGKIDPVFGRDQEIRQMVDILARRRKNNPILVGEPGVGKTAVLEGLALRIVEGDVPSVLEGVRLLSLDMGLLEAGAGMKGEFERRLKGVLDEIKASEQGIVLFIDEAHMLVGAGGAQGGSDAANLMKPALARGEIRTCAATTWKEYKKYFEKDAALARRFQLVKLDEPSVETATLILRGIRPNYEKSHGVLVRDDALSACASYSHRYITSGRFLPDKAIDLLDTACARVKVSLSAKPAPLEDAIRAAQATEREIKGIERDQDNGLSIDQEQLSKLRERFESLKAKSDGLEADWLEEKETAHEYISARGAMIEAKKAMDYPQEELPEGEAPKSQEELADALAKAKEAFEQAKAKLEALQSKGPLIHVEVTPEIVAQIVSDWTGIPAGNMAQEQAATVQDLKAKLGERVKGQDPALEAIEKALHASCAGLRSPNQPMGVFLLVGPSGVGKTETGLALAELLFGDEENIVTINMSEFQEKHTVSRLIGSPPGYVGYGEGGMLTEAVRRRPYSVVLLDEAEKAHVDVLNLFYQVFDKGTLTDGEGTEVSFKDTIIMLTSNLASDIIQEMSADDAEFDGESLLAAIRPALSEHFRPALLARMNIVPYRSLESSAMRRIATLKLEAVKKRLFENKKMVLKYSDAVVDKIVERCTETETGARNIEHILSGSVLPRLAQNIVAHMADSAMPKSVLLDVAEDSTFSISFSED